MHVPAYAIDDQTAIKVTDGTVEVVSEGHWKLFTPARKQANRAQETRAARLGRRPLTRAAAVGCDPLPFECHGKKGVSGSSPEEGSASRVGVR
jgi:hypothetical protein